VPIGGPPRAYRVLAGNLSRQGMFLKMPTPFDTGTKVALSLEAGGRVLPFAQGEVVWRDLEDSQQAARGFGVRFTGFLHPRANALVDYLVDHLETGIPLVTPVPSTVWSRRLGWTAGVLAVVLGAVITSGAIKVLHETKELDDEEELAPLLIEKKESERAEVNPSQVQAKASEPEAKAPLPDAKTPPVEAKAPEPKSPPIETKAPAAKAPAGESATPWDPESMPWRRNTATPIASGEVAHPRPAVPEPAKAPAEAPRIRTVAIPSGAARSMGSSLNGSQLDLSLALAPGASITRAFTLRNPNRVAIDIHGPMPKRSHSLTSSGEILRVRVGRIASGTRLVLDLAHAPGTPVVSGASVGVPFH
jgi:hypothetical protein